MASSSQKNNHSEPAKIEKIITEFFAKSLHIILESRLPCASSRNHSGEQTLPSPFSLSSSSSPSIKPRDKWFNLALRECPAALEKLDLWRPINLETMIVDVLLVQRPVDLDPIRCSPSGDLVRNLSFKERFQGEKIIERWVVQYESLKSRDSSSRSKRYGGSDSHSLYKKSIILLRSLYLTARVLPAYKLFRHLSSSSKLSTFHLAHRVSSFVEPFTHREEAVMKNFGFTPVDTSCCRLCMSVLYQPTPLDVSFEPLILISKQPQFMPDYVGNPTTRRSLERILSLPVASHGSENRLPMLVSPSPSPSPRTHFPANPLSKILLRPESAPVWCPSLPNNNALPPSPSHRDSKPGDSSQTDNVTALNRFGNVQTDAKIQKMNSFGKDEVGNLSGAKLSTNSSPRISISRSSGRLPSLDEFHDSKFACPFVLDDDTSDPRTRAQSFDAKGHLSQPLEPGGLLPLRQSQDAAVGALVHMLRTAPPLRQDFSNSNKSPKTSKTEIWNKSMDEPATESVEVRNAPPGTDITSSKFLTLKTTAKALEELRSYGKIKDLLLRQGIGSQT